MSMRTTEIEVRDPNTDTIPLDVRFDPETQIGELSHYLVSQDGSEIIITYAMAESLFSAVKRLEMCRPARVEETWQSNWKTEKPVLLPVSAEAILEELVEETDAALIAAHEREACAKVCDETLRDHYAKQDKPAMEQTMLFAAIADCAAAIRARGEK